MACSLLQLCKILDERSLKLALRDARDKVLDWLRSHETSELYKDYDLLDHLGFSCPSGTSTYAPYIDFILHKKEPLRNFRFILSGFSLHREPYTSVLHEKILNEIAPPLMFTVGDLQDLVIAHLIATDEEFDFAYNRFRSSVLELIFEVRLSSEFYVSRGDLFYGGSEKWDGMWFLPEPSNPSQQSDSLLILETRGSFFDSESDSDYALMGRVAGKASRNGINSLAETIGALAKSAFITAKHQQFTDGGIHLPIFEKTCCQYLDLYFGQKSKKDAESLRRRVFNALSLLAEADKQEHSGIGLSLAMSAIEALVCRTKDSIADQLARNTATLLEPEKEYRQAAMKRLKKLYNLRSKLLHGENISEADEEMSVARGIASAVLNAVLERQDFWKRLGDDPENPDALFVALDEAHTLANRVDGVSDTWAMKYWRPADAKPDEQRGK